MATQDFFLFRCHALKIAALFLSLSFVLLIYSFFFKAYLSQTHYLSNSLNILF